MCLKFLTEKQLTTTAIEALVAEFGVAIEPMSEDSKATWEYVLSYNTFTNLEALDILSDCLMVG